jgi:hypothetical protein
LVELLVSTTILLAVLGSVCQLASPAHATAIVQAEMEDMQQRARVVAGRLTGDLWLAGAGTISGARHGPLLSYFAAIVPAAWCGSSADPPGSVFSDRLTIAFVPRGSPEAVTATEISPDALRLDVGPASLCPSSVAVCGFEQDDLLVVFDGSGGFDTFRLDLSSGLPMLSPRASPFTAHYPPGSTVARVSIRAYSFDAASRQLFVAENGGAAQPIVDHVTLLRFEYADEEGNGLDGRLADGPWLGSGGTLYDADLRRIRRVRATFTIRSGLAGTGALAIRDLTSTIDVALRNVGSVP